MTQQALSVQATGATVMAAQQTQYTKKAQKLKDLLEKSRGMHLCCQEQKALLQTAFEGVFKTPNHENSEELSRVIGNITLSTEMDSKNLAQHVQNNMKRTQDLTAMALADTKPTSEELLALGATLPSAQVHVDFVATFEPETGIVLAACKRLRTVLFNLRHHQHLQAPAPDINSLQHDADFQLLYALAHSLAFADSLQKQQQNMAEKLAIFRRVREMAH